MIPRSYQKIRDLPQKKDIKPCEGVGKYFDDHLKNNKSMTELSSYGKDLINQFCKQNERMEKKLKDNEEKIWKYKHSKPEIEFNKWKPSNHIIEEFSKSISDSTFELNNRTGKGDSRDIAAKPDKIHSFAVERRKPFYNEEPFWNSHKDGGYFFDRAGVNIHKY